MKKKFPKPFITLIALITVFTGVVIGVNAAENTNELTTPVFFDESITDTSELRTNAITTKRTTVTQTSYPQVSFVVSTNSTSYNPTTLPPATTFTRPQTEAASYSSPLFDGYYYGYGDGWDSVTRYYEYPSNPYTQGYVPTGLPSTTNYEGYPICAQCGDDVWWQFDTQTGELNIYGKGEVYNMEVPQWWDSRDYIKKVVIGDDITNISFFAFADCSQLTEVVIGNSVETIGAFAFSECANLRSVVIPDSVKVIDSMAFYGCTSLESITMSSNIEHLGRNSFTDSGYYNNPENWEDGVLYIGNCLVDSEYSSLSKIETYTIKEGTRVIAAGAFMHSYAQSIVIPESVVEIGECAFRWTEIKSIEIPEGTKTIRKGAFDFCYDLESVHIPTSVETIEEDVFCDCPSLMQITVDENNHYFTVDEYGALYTADNLLLIQFPAGKNIETYTVSSETKRIANYAFAYSQIENIILNDGLESIGICAFMSCSEMESIVIPDSVNWIENQAFAWCDNLKSVDLGNANISFNAPDRIFDYDNNIEYLSLGAGFSSDIYYLNLNFSIKNITVSPDNEYYSSDEYGVLYNKDKTVLYKYPVAGERTSYEIPYGVQIIGYNAFSGATNLSEITLPASLINIGVSAFYECTSIGKVYYTGSEEDWEYVYNDSSNFDYIGNSPICLDTEEAPEHPEPSAPSWWDETTTRFYEDTTHSGNFPSSSTTTSPYDEEYGTYGVFSYVISNGEVTITDCDESASGKIVIPDEIEGYPVIQIGKDAFAECFDVTKIFIPASVLSIADSAFRYCFNLSEITVSNENSVYFIDNSALCSDEYIICLPPKSGVTEYRVDDKSVQGLAFAFCEDLEYIYFGETAYLDDDGEWLAFCPNLKAFVVDEGNTQISSDANGALYDASKTHLLHWPSNSTAKDIILPDSVADIEQFAFVGEYDGVLYLNESFGSDSDYTYILSLYATFKGFSVPESNPYIATENGVLYNKDKTTLIKYPLGKVLDYYEIPESINCVCNQAFVSGNLVNFPTMIMTGEECSEYFFMPKDLTVHIPESLAELMLDESSGSEIIYGLLGAGKFCSDADENTIVSINRTIQELYSSYSEFQIMQPSGFEVICCSSESLMITGICGENLIWSLNESTGELIVFGSGDMYDYSYSEGPWSLYHELIKTLKISDGVTSVGVSAFDYCYNIVSVELPDSLNSIGEYAFCNCRSLTSIEIPEGVTEIAAHAFTACYNLESVIIPEGVTSIGEDAFGSCYNLIEIEIPESVTSIGDYAFYYCSNVTEINIPESVISIGYCAFESCYALSKITVHPSNAQYSSDENGVLFNKDKTVLIVYPAGNERTSYVVPDSVIVIEEYAFGRCQNLLNVILSDNVISIGFGAFIECSGLADIVIPENIFYIGDDAFYGCDSLERITVDPTNAYYSNDKSGALFDKRKTELIVYPAGNIQSSYVTPESVNYIADHAFVNCFYLTTIYISEGVTEIGCASFDWCVNLTKINLPRTLKSIGNYAFSSCINLENIEIPDGVTIIREYAFFNSVNLKSVTIHSSVETIYENVFDNCINMTDIYFCGTQDEWNSIDISENNEVLYNANLNFGSAISSENVIADCGETVSIPVKITNNPGLMGFSVILDYDETVMTPISVKAGDILEGGTLNDSIGGNMSAGKLKVVYTADENVEYDGTIFNVEFEIDEEAYGEYEIELSYIPNDTFNEDFEDVVLSCKGSTVMIEDPSEKGKAKFYIDDMQVNAGEEIIVPVNLYVGSEGLSDFELTLSYNSDIFTYKGYGAIFNVLSISEDIENGTVDFTVGSMHIPGNCDYEVAYFIFSVKDYIECTETISVLCSNAYYNNTQIETICKNGKIAIINPHTNEPAIICTDNSFAITNGYVDVPIYIKNNHGIMGFRMNAVYDSSGLEPVSLTKGALLSKGSFDNNIGIIPGNIKVVWNNTEDIDDNGLLYTLRFRVIDNSITELPLSIMYSQADTYNEKWEDVVLNIDIGAISIKREYTATFMADGVVVSTQKFTVDTEKLIEPAIPSKAGYIARWENYTLKEENLIIRAKYESPSAVMVAKQTIKVDDITRLLPSCNFEVTRKEWFSSKPGVASVDSRGNVMAVSEGKCTILVTCYGLDSFGNEIKATASTKIVVNEKSETETLKERFREAFNEFFEVKLYDVIENLKKFLIVLFGYAY